MLLITEADLFKGVSQRAVSKIGGECTDEAFKRGAGIFKAGEEAAYFYVLLDGSVDISAGTKDSLHFAVSRPGAVIGWSALVEPFTYTASASAMTPVKVIKVPREAIEHVLKKYPEDGLLILRHLTGIIAQRLRDAYANVASEAPI